MRTILRMDPLLPSLPETGGLWIVPWIGRVIPNRRPFRDPYPLTPQRDSFSEEELISRIVLRDEAAFAEIYDRCAPKLLGLAMAVLKSRPEAEDVIQETFLYIWNNAGHFDPSRGSAFTWMALTVRHRSIDRLRSLARRNPRRLESPDAAAFESPETSIPDQAAADHDRHLHAKALLNGLPEEQRNMLALAFLQGLTHSEISSRLNLPLGSVKTAIRRGLMRLRGSHQPEPEDMP